MSGNDHDDCRITTPFNPPLWQQRRTLVIRILREFQAETVIDFGCGEGSLLATLLNDTSFSQLAGVDINVEELERAKVECSPTEYDQRFLRERPISLDLYHGSVDQVDSRLMGFDAIACVEVVEHLDPPVLAAFPEVTLGTYRPRVMVVTTPNAEFNVNFPNLKYGTPEATLRNADHRFEWTRKEFQEWCNAAAAKYGYIVSFSGVGSFGSKEYGHCTQLAVFSRVGDEIEENKRNQNQLPTKADVEATSKRNQPYKHLTRLEFPYYDSQDEVTDDKIVEELKDSTCHILYNEMYSSLAGLSAEEQDKTPVERYFEDFKRSFGDIDFGNYWSLLKIRQYCKTREKLIDVFRTQAASALLELVPALPEQLEAKLKARRSSAWGDQLPDLPESQKPWRVRIKFDVPPPPVFSENDDMEREDVNDSSSEEDDDEYVREGDEYHAYDYDHEEPWVESYDKTGEGGDAKSWEPDESYTPQSPVVGWGDPPAASDILSPWGFAS